MYDNLCHITRAAKAWAGSSLGGIVINLFYYRIMIESLDFKEWPVLQSFRDKRVFIDNIVIGAGNGKIVRAEGLPGGFHEGNSFMYVADQFGYDQLSKFEQLRNNVRRTIFSPEKFDRAIKEMGREYKIHLMPQEQYIPHVLQKLSDILNKFSNACLIPAFKTRLYVPQNELEAASDSRGTVVLYCAYANTRTDARKNFERALQMLVKELTHFGTQAEQRVPDMNWGVTPLISVQQIGTDFRRGGVAQALYNNQERFDKYFPAAFNYAFLYDEKPPLI